MLNISKKILLTSAIFDSIINAWFCTWWVAVFVKMLNTRAISIRTIVESATGLIVSFIIVKHIKIPSIKLILIADFFAYANLIFLWYYVDAFYIIGGFFTAVVGFLVMSFNSAILAQNLKNPQKRIDFDNKYNFIRTLGSIIGGSIAYFYMLTFIDFKILWVLIYFLYDIDLFLRIYLVKTNKVHYDLKEGE